MKWPHKHPRQLIDPVFLGRPDASGPEDFKMPPFANKEGISASKRPLLPQWLWLVGNKRKNTK
jgi:hypothetical protein